MEKKQTVSECFQDIRDILPTLLILVIGLVIMILVIPYAFRLVTIIKLVVISNTFSSVFKQLAQEREMNRVGIVTSVQNTFPYRLAPYLNILYPPPNP